jgi:hypothetical protein
LPQAFTLHRSVQLLAARLLSLEAVLGFTLPAGMLLPRQLPAKTLPDAMQASDACLVQMHR